MQLSVQVPRLPLRIRFDEPLTDAKLEEFCALNSPYRVEREENGELTLMSPNSSDNGAIEAELSAELILWTRQEGRGKVFGPNAGFTLPDSSVRAADLSWVTLERWNALATAQQQSFAPLCPDFIIEVRSKSDRLKTIKSKMQKWIANGVSLAWLIDPRRRTVEIYRPGEAPEMHNNPTSIYGTGPVAGFELILSRIWS